MFYSLHAKKIQQIFSYFTNETITLVDIFKVGKSYKAMHGLAELYLIISQPTLPPCQSIKNKNLKRICQKKCLVIHRGETYFIVCFLHTFQITTDDLYYLPPFDKNYRLLFPSLLLLFDNVNGW